MRLLCILYDDVQIVMKTKEAAKGAKEDGDNFDLNDGENTSVMK